MADVSKTDMILSVGIGKDDGLALDKILLDSNWQSHCTGNCQEAFKFLNHHHVSVVLSQPELPDGTWRELLNGMAELSAPPSLIISSRLADHLLWAEVLNLGGYDVLMTPFGAEEVLRVIGGAQRDWERNNVGGYARAARAGQPGTPS